MQKPALTIALGLSLAACQGTPQPNESASIVNGALAIYGEPDSSSQLSLLQRVRGVVEHAAAGRREVTFVDAGRRRGERRDQGPERRSRR